MQFSDWFQFVGPNHALEIAGVKLLGVDADTGKRLLFTLIYVAGVMIVSRLLRVAARLLLRGRENVRVKFWTGQGIRLISAVLALLGVLSIWFNDPARLATAVGLVTAGLAFALQKVVMALAGYAVILRGNTFNVGDRIRMGGVRGDVVSLSFIQTTIMEMGDQPKGDDNSTAGAWVKSLQYTGRVVTVTNDKIFEEPVYNFTREFPYIWEEINLPVPYTADRARVEQILLEVTNRHTRQVREVALEKMDEVQRHFFMREPDLTPKVYYRLTSNWLELTVRFFAEATGVRALKDKISRDLLQALNEIGVGIASTTFEITGLPALRVERARPAPAETEA